MTSRHSRKETKPEFLGSLIRRTPHREYYPAVRYNGEIIKIGDPVKLYNSTGPENHLGVILGLFTAKKSDFHSHNGVSHGNGGEERASPYLEHRSRGGPRKAAARSFLAAEELSEEKEKEKEKEGEEDEAFAIIQWFYRVGDLPQEMRKQHQMHKSEIFLSNHRDENSVVTIVRKCYVQSEGTPHTPLQLPEFFCNRMYFFAAVPAIQPLPSSCKFSVQDQLSDDFDSAATHPLVTQFNPPKKFTDVNKSPVKSDPGSPGRKRGNTPEGKESPRKSIRLSSTRGPRSQLSQDPPQAVDLSDLEPLHPEPKPQAEVSQADVLEVLELLKKDPLFSENLERKVTQSLALDDNSKDYIWTRAILEACFTDKNVGDCLDSLAILHGFVIE